MDHRREKQRRIGGTAGDDDICAAAERRGHRLRAEIRIRRENLVAETAHGALEFEDRQVAVLAGVQHIVADDSGDLEFRKAHRLRDLSGLARSGFRIGGTHIGDDLDALGGADRQHRTHPVFKQGIETAVRVLHPRLLRQRHRAFAETFEHEILDVALLGEFDRGLDTVPGIAGA